MLRNWRDQTVVGVARTACINLTSAISLHPDAGNSRPGAGRHCGAQFAWQRCSSHQGPGTRYDSRMAMVLHLQASLPMLQICFAAFAMRIAGCHNLPTCATLDTLETVAHAYAAHLQCNTNRFVPPHQLLFPTTQIADSHRTTQQPHSSSFLPPPWRTPHTYNN